MTAPSPRARLLMAAVTILAFFVLAAVLLWCATAPRTS